MERRREDFSSIASLSPFLLLVKIELEDVRLSICLKCSLVFLRFNAAVDSGLSNDSIPPGLFERQR